MNKNFSHHHPESYYKDTTYRAGECLVVKGNPTVKWYIAANIDGLTGLHNRLSMEKHLAAAIAEELKETNPPNKNVRKVSSGVAIVFIDLDGFKKINDTFGHQAGDDVLKKIGDFLTREIRPKRKHEYTAFHESLLPTKSIVSRLGGDEFVMILRGTNKQQLYNWISGIEERLNSLQTRLVIEDGKTATIDIRGSLGVHICDLKMSPEDNLAMADQKMYEMKAQRKEKERQKNPNFGDERLVKYTVNDGSGQNNIPSLCSYKPPSLE